MQKNIRSFRFIAMLITAISFTACTKVMDTNSSTAISDEMAEASATNLNMVLTSTYRELFFNIQGSENAGPQNLPGGDGVYAGLTGLQMYVDIGGADILSHTNMGYNPVTTYKYDPVKTQFTGNASAIWQSMYLSINQANIILDNIDAATGEADFKDQIKGQALAIRGLCYFHLIQNYQQTYMLAKNKPGVILRTSSTQDNSLPRATVEECYQQILSDLKGAKESLAKFTRSNKWTIDKTIVSGILARVYLVMNDWTNALAEATTVYSQYNQLMTRDQFRSGFDDAITNNYAEVAWAVPFTSTDNLGGETQFNFWYNQDASYGEGYSDGPIYSFLNLFADGEFEQLFEKTDDRYQFWKRTNNASAEINTKWAYDKYKHYGDGGGAVQSNTRPEVTLMRGAEMLLIMAEASAQLNNGNGLTYLNNLQKARNVKNLTNASGKDLLEAIYVERRKELLCEGVTGIYDLLRLQKPLIRKCQTPSYVEGHYTWGVSFLDGYNASSANPVGTIPSNDYRFICQIPQMEFANNKALTAADQNPFQGQ
ncbi:RagB/SusD family nutrient uptake outer membrane protein [Danxiaibacter flavus]|uniref:RagB/SusD family nutrient uptake outer membrane protein n=1 Tax=Danxiaibacter flavus TaxID=3049108 RepID=A0ABV3ZFV2_9BACT|nr:RagB/SusD family nutrient uptake outer membrane protein [Chitinophagaceae bacterium DXS]